MFNEDEMGRTDITTEELFKFLVLNMSNGKFTHFSCTDNQMDLV